MGFTYVELIDYVGWGRVPVSSDARRGVLEAGVAGSYEPPGVSAENQTKIL